MTTRKRRKVVAIETALARHRRNCPVCAHAQREEIEREFIRWRPPGVIVQAYGLGDVAALERHAQALGLFAKRQRNVRTALECLIEHAAEVEATASTVVSAITAYAKINAQGQWIERPRHPNLNELFQRMNPEEVEAYACEGKLPEWFKREASTASATLGTTAAPTEGESDED